MTRATTILILALTMPFVAAQDQAPSDVESLRARLEELLAEHEIPSMGVAIVSGAETEWVAGLGTADRATGDAATPDTLYRIGSISKMFVALSLLKLQEEGRVDLEDLVRDHAPEIEFTNPYQQSSPLRIVHLLEHTGGFDDLHLVEYAHNEPGPMSLRSGLDFHPHSRICRWPPGTHFSYANSGPALAAYIVEKLTGERFEDYVQKHFFDPLGMTTASYFYEPFVQENLAKAYRGDNEIPYWHILMRPSGAINASAREMANLTRMLINRGRFDDTQMLAPASIQRMETPMTTLAGRRGIRTGYGLGNFSTVENGHIFWGHNGGTNSHLASLGYLPHEQRGYVALVASPNAEGAQEIFRTLREYLIRDLPRPEPALTAVPSSHYAGLAGYYRPITPRQELTRFAENIFGVVRLAFEGSSLSLAGSEEKYLLPVTDRIFRGPDDPVPTTLFDQERQEIVLQATGSVLRGNYRRVSGVRIWVERILLAAGLFLMVTSPITALYWLFRQSRARGSGEAIWLWLLPLASSLSLVLMTLLLINGLGGDPIRTLGHPTPVSVGITAFSWVFAATAGLGFLRALLGLVTCPNRLLRWHSLVVSLACLGLAVYLAYHGIIGIRFWSY